MVAAMLLLLLPVPGFCAESPYYVWTDKDGIANFSQDRPRDVAAKEVSSTKRFGRQENLSATPKQLSSVDQANQATRDTNCASGKRTLEKLRGFKNVIVKNAEG